MCRRRVAGLRHSTALSLALLVACAGTAARAADAAADAQAYTLAPGDRVTVTVFGQPELSGEFAVDGAGNLLLTLIGAVPAADATLAEIQKRVAERLADGYIQDPKVSVRISELRPVYVLGDVKAPGSYPYRYGMSVLTAIALAGGGSLTEERQELLRTEILAAEERVGVLTAGHQALLARRARLVAQRDGASEITFPPALLGAAGEPQMADLLEGERTIFALQQATQRQELELLRQQLPHIRAQVQAIGTQRRLEQRQLDLVQSQVEDANKLMNSGLARRASVIELQRAAAAIEGNIAKYAADAATAEQALGDIAIKIQDAETGYRRRVMVELQETQTKLMETEASLAGAREARDLKLHQAGLAAGALAAQGTKSGIEVLQYGKDGLRVVEATETTILRPGDIVRVATGTSFGGKALLPGGNANAPAPGTVAGLTKPAR